MENNVYKKIEVTGTSTSTMEDAILNAIGRASETIRNMRWFEVIESRGSIENGSVAEWQVTVKIGFTLDKS
ncbi:MAG: dodecin family protein [Anaerolineales bacterium]|jgi:dodecin